MKFLKKKNKILVVFKYIKDLDPFFFELLTDSIKDSNKTLKLNKSFKFLLIIYSNIFAAKKLNILLAKKEILDINIKNNITSLDFERTQKLIIKIELGYRQLGSELKRNLFYDLYLSRYNELLISQVVNNIKTIQSLDKI